MKDIKTIMGLIIATVGLLAFTNGGQYETLKIGEKATLLDYEMKSTSGESMSLNQLKKVNGTLVIFSCNTCPFVIAWEGRYPEIANMANENQIGFALINSNEAKRNSEDSMEEMIAHAKVKGYSNIPYLVDQRSKLANAFGAKSTPHVFLFDKDWKLVYEGAIDDNHKDAEGVTKKYLENALQNLAKGEEINPKNTNALGCSIKRSAG
ncbi:MAG: thioredoxin family protein [Flavobacteriales bacterium]|nr:thioredoxin family protein [Flavobacteriales bacterium]